MSLRIQSSAEQTKFEGIKTWASSSAKTVVIENNQGISGEMEQDGKLTAEEVDVESAVEGLNKAVEHVNRGLRFAVHEDTERLMVKVVNVATDEVIKEIPPEEILDTMARIREAIGLLIDAKA